MGGVGGGSAPVPDSYLTLEALAAYSSLSIATLRRALRDPKHPLPHRRYGRRILVKRSAFDAWLTSLGT